MVRDERTNRKKRKGNGMLIRLLLTISVLICIPLFLANIYIVNSDMKKMQEQEIQNFQTYVENFKEFFSDETEKMFACSIDLSVNKTVREDVIGENAKYLWDAFSEVKKYRNSIPAAEDVFVYMKSIDYVVGSECGYKGGYFTKLFLEEGQEWLVDFTEHLDEKNYFVKADTDKAGMFVIYPASVRKSGDTTVFFYMTAETLDDVFYSLDNSDVGMCIFNEEAELLLSNKEVIQPVLEQTDFLDFVKDPSEKTEKCGADGREWYLFKAYDGENGLIFLAVVPADRILQPMERVRSTNNMLLLLEFFLCIVMLMFVVHLNYQPIRMLKHKYLDDSVGEAKNEIDGIDRLLDQTLSDKQSLGKLVQERTEQLSVYVIRDMLNGEEIPEEQKKLLRLNDAIRYVFVMAVQGIASDSDIEGELVEKLTDRSDKIVYSMVDSYEQCVMFVCLMAEESQSVRETMAQKLQIMLANEALDQNFKLGIGEFSRIDEGIRTARQTALIALDQSSDGEIMYYEKALYDFRHVEHYPNKQMLTYMRYLKEGNREQALLMLDQIIYNIRKKLPSVIIGRYVCYDIVNEFIRLIASLDVKIEEGKIMKLMRFENLDELQSILAELTAMTCQVIEDRKLSVEKEQINRIIQFIDENISDPDLSRELVAERFKISVNTVSLVCTNLIGCGFRELIVARRVELAQKLFQETELSVNEVAIRSGFRDTSYFIKIFKSITGKTPRVYKNEIKES